MSKFLANENVPASSIDAARKAGHDVAWVAESAPGATDDAVLQLSLAEGRVLVTFDKDFGEMVFRLGNAASCGVILMRPRLSSPVDLAQFTTAVLAQQIDWEGHFSVAREGRVRVVPLPGD